MTVETKTWFDPRTPDGKSKLIKAIFALRNRNGGSLVIGFQDDTLLPDVYSLSDAAEEVFHLDEIQGAVSKYANQPFEVEVYFPILQGVVHPIIYVPEGVRTPVVVKADLSQDTSSSKNLLTKGDLYFRTLRSNGTPSSAKITPTDYSEMLDICFENREADIGRFLRRHLGGVEREALLDAISPAGLNKTAVLKARCDILVKRGDAEFAVEVGSRAITQKMLTLPEHPLTMRVALCLSPLVADAVPTQDFLRAFTSGNPSYTGWPMWLDSRNFTDEQSRPKVKHGAWQALILDLESDFPHSDFMLLDPRGDFYLRRLMQDDLHRKQGEQKRLLDVVLMIYRIAEVLAVGVSIAKSCGWPTEGSAGFGLRWSGLKGRSLGAWANPLNWDESGSGTAYDTEAASFVMVPLDTPLNSLAPFVSKAVEPLFSSFSGHVVSMKLVEDCVQRLIERRMQ